jgi:hypothetical protein
MRVIRSTAAILGFALATLPAFAQSQPAQESRSASTTAPVPADQQATKAQIDKLFELLRLRKQMESMMGMIPRVVQQSFQAQMKDMNAKLPPGKRLMPQDQAALEKVMNKYMQEAVNVYPIDEMIADAVPVYQRHISRSDADAVIAFYSSPPGQRLLDEQPAMMSEYMAILMPHLQDRSKRLTDRMEAEMQQIVKPDPVDPGNSSPKPE